MTEIPLGMFYCNISKEVMTTYKDRAAEIQCYILSAQAHANARLESAIFFTYAGVRAGIMSLADTTCIFCQVEAVFSDGLVVTLGDVVHV